MGANNSKQSLDEDDKRKLLIPNRSDSDVNLSNKRGTYTAATPSNRPGQANRRTASGEEEATGLLEENDLEAPTIDEVPFVYSHGISSSEAERLLGIHGRNVLPEKKIPKWYIFVSQLWQPMPIMIWIAAIIEAAIQNWIDMGILLFIQFANASIAFYEITKAGDAVDALKKSLQPKATAKRDGKWQEISATLVVPGDLVLLASGSAIPADCRVNKGQIDVDQAALTGESLPVTMLASDACKMGSTVVRGETEGTVEFTGEGSFTWLYIICWKVFK